MKLPLSYFLIKLSYEHDFHTVIFEYLVYKDKF